SRRPALQGQAANRENRKSPPETPQAARPAAAVRDPQSSSAAPLAAPRFNSANAEMPAAGEPLRSQSSGRHRQAVRCGGESSLNERHPASHSQAKLPPKKR